MTSVMDARDKAISIVKSKGPLLPFQIAKEIGSNLIIASAYLSELASKGIVKISNLKVGGSPLYYAPGQEPKLQNFSSNLGEKEKKAYELLREKKVLEDTSLSPVERVALREIKDFAVPLRVAIESNTYLFWKWYLLSNKDAEPLINSVLNLKPEMPQAISNSNNITQQQPIQQKIHHPKAILEQQIKEQRESLKKTTELSKDSLYSSVVDYFVKNKINILSHEIVKKNSEIDFIVDIPSPLGNLTYYCKTKIKKRISDSDLKSAYVSGQLKKLPVVFLAKGELSKKAGVILKELKGLTFMKL